MKLSNWKSGTGGLPGDEVPDPLRAALAHQYFVLAAQDEADEKQADETEAGKERRDPDFRRIGSCVAHAQFAGSLVQRVPPFH